MRIFGVDRQVTIHSDGPDTIRFIMRAGGIHRVLYFHRQIGVPRLISRLGAWMHGAAASHWELHDCVGTSPGVILSTSGNWLYVNDPEYGHGSFPLLTREETPVLWTWLVSWHAQEIDE